MSTRILGPMLAPTWEEVDAARCKRCGYRSDWHAADTLACPEDDYPHPYSYAADDVDGRPA